MKFLLPLNATLLILLVVTMGACSKNDGGPGYNGFKSGDYIFTIDSLIKYSTPLADSAIVLSSSNNGARLGIYLRNTHWPTVDGFYTYQMGIDSAAINFRLFAPVISETYQYYTINNTLSRTTATLELKHGIWKLQVPQVRAASPDGDVRTFGVSFSY